VTVVRLSRGFGISHWSSNLYPVLLSLSLSLSLSFSHPVAHTRDALFIHVDVNIRLRVYAFSITTTTTTTPTHFIHRYIRFLPRFYPPVPRCLFRPIRHCCTPSHRVRCSVSNIRINIPGNVYIRTRFLFFIFFTFCLSTNWYAYISIKRLLFKHFFSPHHVSP
jgi:hypothetical protein